MMVLIYGAVAVFILILVGITLANVYEANEKLDDVESALMLLLKYASIKLEELDAREPEINADKIKHMNVSQLAQHLSFVEKAVSEGDVGPWSAERWEGWLNLKWSK